MSQKTQSIRKYLPYGYRNKIVKSLASVGIIITAQEVTNIMAGQQRNADLTEKVLSEAKKLANTNKRKIMHAKQLKSILK